MMLDLYFGLLIAAAEFGILVLACYLVMIVQFFLHKDWGMAILCLACALICFGGLCFGIPAAILAGWFKAKKWDLQPFMVVWTILFGFLVINIGGAIAVRGFLEYSPGLP
jgi:hypothetical protein